MTEVHKGLALLRVPFEAKHISKLPKPTKQQTEAVKADFKKGTRCALCGAWHHPDVVHLDYVGHAALTHRLLDADPGWTWEPLAMADGLPVLDNFGGMWIRLTVCGVTRLGYGHAGEKSGGDAIKEVIGDALRNAAMRFGAALDLWHKGDLHDDHHDDDAKAAATAAAAKAAAAAAKAAAAIAASVDAKIEAAAAKAAAAKGESPPPKMTQEQIADWLASISAAAPGDELRTVLKDACERARQAADRDAYAAFRAAFKKREGVAA